MTSELPILSLPMLALAECLKMLSPSELLILSLGSQRIRRLIKAYRDKSISWEIELIDRPTLKVSLKHGGAFFDIIGASKIVQDFFTYENTRFGNTIIPFALTERKKFLNTLWNEEECNKGFKLVADYVMDLFDSPIHSLSIEVKNKWIIEWLNKQQEEALRYGYISNESECEFTDDDFSKILSSLQVTRHLSLTASPSETFRFTESVEKCDSIYMKFGHWVTVENLLSMDSNYITIFSSRLTSSDFNVYLKHWLSGGNNRLKCIRIELVSVDVSQVLEGVFDKVVLMENQVRNYETYGNDIIRFFSGYDTQREDGVKATIVLNDGMFAWIAVWPVV